MVRAAARPRPRRSVLLAKTRSSRDSRDGRDRGHSVDRSSSNDAAENVSETRTSSKQLRVGDHVMLKLDQHNQNTFAARCNDTRGFGLSWITAADNAIDRPPDTVESVFLILRSGQFASTTKLRKLKEAGMSDWEAVQSGLHAAVQSEQLINSMQVIRLTSGSARAAAHQWLTIGFGDRLNETKAHCCTMVILSYSSMSAPAATYPILWEAS